MGLLDDVLWNLGPELPTLAGRRAARVLSKGEASEAAIVGILVERTTDGELIEPEYRYALDVRTGFGTSRVGVRQRLGGSRRSDAHVGATLPVKVHDEKVVIDWRHLEAEGEVVVGTWRMVDPPPEGVEDRWRKKERKRIDAGAPGSITVLRATPVSSALGPTENLDLDVQLRLTVGTEPEFRRLDRVLPPDYARFLVKVGAILPVGVDEDGRRITIDWERAANGGTGFDPAPPEPPAPAPREPGAGERAMGAVDAFVTRYVGAGDPAAAGDVTLETYVEIQVGLILDRVTPADADAYAACHGVPAGTWATVDAAWKARTMTAEHGTQFGALFSERMKAAKKERKKRR